MRYQGPRAPCELKKGAVFSTCGRYRYKLWRVWDLVAPYVTFVMLNPSKAGAEEDDATIRRCTRFARDWGYGGIAVVNLCALVSTDPVALHTLPLDEVVGPNNDYYLADTLLQEGCGLVVVAWGANVEKHAGLDVAAYRVLQRIDGLGWLPHCLGTTKGGSPLHPLRLPASLLPVPFRVDRPGAPATVEA